MTLGLLQEVRMLNNQECRQPLMALGQKQSDEKFYIKIIIKKRSVFLLLYLISIRKHFKGLFPVPQVQPGRRSEVRRDRA